MEHFKPIAFFVEREHTCPMGPLRGLLRHARHSLISCLTTLSKVFSVFQDEALLSNDMISPYDGCLHEYRESLRVLLLPA